MPERGNQQIAGGFTLLELVVTMAILLLLAALVLPALAGARSKARSFYCLNNLRQLSIGCFSYAADHEDRLPYNLGADDIKRWVGQYNYANWTSSVMSWELDPDNTNTWLLTQGGIGPEVGGVAGVYRCPADTVVSDIQARAGWSARVRSYSMNAMVGDAGAYTRGGTNVNNPGYRQFFNLGQITEPARIFVFIEEHPDSINDGYFLNRSDSLEWTDLPASYHGGAANLTFADGHAESHKWSEPSTRLPPRPDAARLPFQVTAAERSDFEWLMRRTSLDIE